MAVALAWLSEKTYDRRYEDVGGLVQTPAAFNAASNSPMFVSALRVPAFPKAR